MAPKTISSGIEARSFVRRAGTTLTVRFHEGDAIRRRRTFDTLADAVDFRPSTSISSASNQPGAVQCTAQPGTRSDFMTTLNLPRLTLEKARNVEAALIAHFGIEGKSRNGDVATVGQLFNRRHEISVERAEYCGRLLVGQYILLRNGYGFYAAASFTRGKRCPGVGGPR